MDGISPTGVVWQVVKVICWRPLEWRCGMLKWADPRGRSKSTQPAPPPRHMTAHNHVCPFKCSRVVFKLMLAPHPPTHSFSYFQPLADSSQWWRRRRRRVSGVSSRCRPDLSPGLISILAGSTHWFPLSRMLGNGLNVTCSNKAWGGAFRLFFLYRITIKMPLFIPHRGILDDLSDM